MNKKKFLIIILLVVLVILIFFAIHIIKNLIIITDIEKNLSRYENSMNYHLISTSDGKNGIKKIEYYKKDEKTATFIEGTNGVKMLWYDNGKRTDLFIDDNNKKVANIDHNGKPFDMAISSPFVPNDHVNKWLYAVKAFIKTEEYNGKECYVINYKIGSEQSISYFEKATGLSLKRIIDGEVVSEIEYEFDNVDDSVFIEPNIAEYEIKK